LAYIKSNLFQKDWPLTIIGDGPLKNEILNIISNSGVSIYTPGFVSDDIKIDLISKSKWLVAPANGQEDLGLTPIEARNLGVPSIVSNDGGLTQSAGPYALVSIPGNIDSLLSCLLKASSMNDNDYDFICKKTKETLSDLIKPLSFYRHEYLNK
jgi:glycosyltransferase involved in cell wall biosynthesis